MSQNQKLFAYFSQQLDKGKSWLSIKDTLYTAGWPKHLVEQACEAYVQQQATGSLKTSIERYVAKQRQKGVSEQDIKEMLKDSYWPSELIQEVLSGKQYELHSIKQEVLQKTYSYLHNKYAGRKNHFYSKYLEKKQVIDFAEQSPSMQRNTQDTVSTASKQVQHVEQRDTEQDFSAQQEHVGTPHFDEPQGRQDSSRAQVAPQHATQQMKQQQSSGVTYVDEQGKPVTIQAQTVQVALPKSLKPANLEELEQQMLTQQSGFYNPLMVDKVELAKEPVGDRAQTGIVGFDAIIEGGLKRKTATMIAGGPGSGKSTMGLQYLYNGAMQYQEPGIYITFEQQTDALVEAGIMFGWDMQRVQDEHLLVIREYTPEQLHKMLTAGGGSFRDLIDSIGAVRVVIDSITAFMLMYKGEKAQRKACIDLFHSLAKWGCTTVVIVEEEYKSGDHHSSVLEYETDGVIILYNERKGDIRQRSLEIFKMRGTRHAGRIFPMKLTPQGLVVYPQ
ncbi:MAG: RAD55 family ATPase [Candidatus Woesearchaeota archaeon]